MIDKKRRTVLKATAAGAMLAGIGLSMPIRVSAKWSEDAFLAEELQKALDAVYGDGSGSVNLSGTQTEAISFEDTKDNPADSRTVPISVSSNVPGTKSISIFIEGNPRPLVARFHFAPNAVPSVNIRSKMRKTSRVIAIIEDGSGKLHSREMTIKVTESGCAA